MDVFIFIYVKWGRRWIDVMFRDAGVCSFDQTNEGLFFRERNECCYLLVFVILWKDIMGKIWTCHHLRVLPTFSFTWCSFYGKNIAIIYHAVILSLMSFLFLKKVRSARKEESQAYWLYGYTSENQFEEKWESCFLDCMQYRLLLWDTVNELLW